MYNSMIFENLIFCVRAVYLVKYFNCIYFLCFQNINNFLVFLRVWIWILLRKLLLGSRVVSFKSNLNSFKSKFVQIFILMILHFCKGQYPWQYIGFLFFKFTLYFVWNPCTIVWMVYMVTKKWRKDLQMEKCIKKIIFQNDRYFLSHNL